MNKHHISKRIVFACIALLLIFVMVFSGFKIWDSVVPSQESPADNAFVSKTITRDGIDYFPRQDLTVFLIMGIDRTGPVESSDSYNNEGAADVAMLAIFDEQAEEYRILTLNRDTMLNMPVLGIGGKPAGTAYGQLALAHTYGSGLEDSCENTRKAISDFLYGLNIDYYVSMNMDAIGILNDAVGGVKVNVTEDFSDVDDSIPMGEVVLNAEQALSYVQSRQGVGDQLNLSRMERQQKYVTGFMESLKSKLESSENFAIELYNNVSEYMISDCSVNTLSSVINRFSDYTLSEIVTPEGENMKGTTYMEFHADEERLDELILRLFYVEK